MVVYRVEKGCTFLLVRVKLREWVVIDIIPLGENLIKQTDENFFEALIYAMQKKSDNEAAPLPFSNIPITVFEILKFLLRSIKVKKIIEIKIN